MLVHVVNIFTGPVPQTVVFLFFWICMAIATMTDWMYGIKFNSITLQFFCYIVCYVVALFVWPICLIYCTWQAFITHLDEMTSNDI